MGAGIKRPRLEATHLSPVPKLSMMDLYRHPPPPCIPELHGGALCNLPNGESGVILGNLSKRKPPLSIHCDINFGLLISKGGVVVQAITRFVCLMSACVIQTIQTACDVYSIWVSP
jgi:hypothetical protein